MGASCNQHFKSQDPSAKEITNRHIDIDFLHFFGYEFKQINRDAFETPPDFGIRLNVYRRLVIADILEMSPHVANQNGRTNS